MSHSDLFILDGRVALVTGGARGLGEASARTMAQMGATVVLADLDTEAVAVTAERLASETGATILARACDVTLSLIHI